MLIDTKTSCLQKLRIFMTLATCWLAIVAAIGWIVGRAMEADHRRMTASTARLHRSGPLTITILNFRTAGFLTSGKYGYRPGPDFSPPQITYLICRVNIIYDGKNSGPIHCSPDGFRIVSKDKSNGKQSLRFWKEHVPKEIEPLPDASLLPGARVSGDLVFEVVSGTTPLFIESSSPVAKDHIVMPNALLE